MTCGSNYLCIYKPLYTKHQTKNFYILLLVVKIITEEMMKYSMNYYSKKSRDMVEFYRKNPDVPVAFINEDKKNIDDDYPVYEINSHEFVVPWQMV